MEAVETYASVLNGTERGATSGRGGTWQEAARFEAARPCRRGTRSLRRLRLRSPRHVAARPLADVRGTDMGWHDSRGRRSAADSEEMR